MAPLRSPDAEAGGARALSALVSAGCGSSSRPPHTTSAAAPPTVPAPPITLPRDCVHSSERPSSFIIACADGGSGVEQLVWHSWGGRIGQASGFAFANDCVPNWVAGGIHHAATEMYVSRVRHCGRTLQYTYAVIVASTASFAGRTMGAYNVACAVPNQQACHGPNRKPKRPARPDPRQVRPPMKKSGRHYVKCRNTPASKARSLSPGVRRNLRARTQRGCLGSGDTNDPFSALRADAFARSAWPLPNVAAVEACDVAAWVFGEAVGIAGMRAAEQILDQSSRQAATHAV